MTDKDIEFLSKLAYKVAHPDSIFFEVGSWKGHSTSVLGKVAKECGGHVFCIDHWEGSPGVWQHELDKDCFTTFRNNIKECELESVVHPLIMESALATTIISNGIADLVFIDADHRFNSVKQDILNWYPKVKVDGILCGHDCEKYYEEYPPNEQDWLKSAKNDDYLDRLRCHAGVIIALYECFGNNFHKEDNSTVWFKRK